MRKGITVMCGGYNEEKRAEQFFKSVSMFDEIIFLNRGCTDKTCEIAGKYHAKIIDIPYVEPEKEHLIVKKHNDDIYSYVSNEWVINLSFADIVHPKLYFKLQKLINKENFDYTVISIPWVEYLFGVEDEYIPRCHYSRPVLRRLDAIKISVVTHHEMKVTVHKEFKMPKNKWVAVHHMTYIGLQYSFKEQHIRYALKEYATYYSNLSNPKKVLFRQMMSEIKENATLIFEGMIKGRNKKIVIHGFAILLYRSVEYYLGIYLVLWSYEKKGVVDDIFQEIYEGLQVSKVKGKIPVKQILKMAMNVFAKASTSFGEDILAFFSTIGILKIMIAMYIWDNRQVKTPEETYNLLKEKILNDC